MARLVDGHPQREGDDKVSDAQNRNGPIERFQDDAVVLKVWEQDGGQKGPFLTYTIGRTYRDPETGEFGESRSFTRAELNKVQGLIVEANQFARNWRAEQKAQRPMQEGQDQAQRNLGLSQQHEEAMQNAAPVPPQDRGITPTR